MKKVLKHLKKVDPKIHGLAERFDLSEVFAVGEKRDYFRDLCREIVGQQLSTKAASTIFGRFEELHPKKKVAPEAVLELEHEQMREVGFSNAKAKYVRGIAGAVVKGEIDLKGLDKLENEAVIVELTKLKGVGVWTAEMFLMFTLKREDVFSVGDLGLRRAMEKLYELEEPSNDELVAMAEKWSPYRTYACRLLWESLDNNPEL